MIKRKRRKNPYSYLMNVDIQPEYERNITFDISNWVDYLNQTSLPIIFLYNGYETLGMISERDYKYWLLENGLNEEVLENSEFYDKGYAYFRYCIDNKISDDLIVSFVSFLYKNKIYDSRSLNSATWNKFFKIEGLKGRDERPIRKLLEFSGDLLSIPDLMFFLKGYNNILLTGGGIYECLKEVEIALKALKKNYKILEEFTY